MDNALDAFKSSAYEQSSSTDKRIIVSWSSENVAAVDRQLEVADTGLGIDLSVIQDSVRAGYTSNNTFSALGLFGMGFNIATARLGDKTTFLSASADSTEWVGVEIDFAELIKSGKFHAPAVRVNKVKSSEHGSKIIVSRLNPAIFAELRKSANQIRKILSDIYSPILRQQEVEIWVQSKLLSASEHCVWGANRYVSVARGQETVPAVLKIDHIAKDGLFDEERNRYLTREEEDEAYKVLNNTSILPTGIVKRAKRIHGWLGIQRYPDPNDFGIDFIRNGRKILRRDRSLFEYKNEITGMSELEYPVELTGTVGGRIVGEIHVDHLPPNYQKNDFDRTDPTWYEMVEVLRGVGPILPNKRKALGYDPDNNSSIGRLVRGYGICRAGTRYLAAPNQIARKYAEEFRKGIFDYLFDDKWWEAAREADRSQADKNADKAPEVDPGSKSSDDLSEYSPLTSSSSPLMEGSEKYPLSDIPSNPATTPSPVTSASTSNRTSSGSQGMWTAVTALPAKKQSPEEALRNSAKIVLADSHSYSYQGCPSPLLVKVWEVTTGNIGEGEDNSPCLMTSSANQCDFFYNPRHPFLRAYPTSYKDLLLVDLAQKFKSRDALPQELAVLFTQLLVENFPDLRIDQVTIQESVNNFFDRLREKIPALLSLREQEVLDRVHEAVGEVEEIVTALIYNTELLHKFQTRSFTFRAVLTGIFPKGHVPSIMLFFLLSGLSGKPQSPAFRVCE